MHPDFRFKLTHINHKEDLQSIVTGKKEKKQDQYMNLRTFLIRPTIMNLQDVELNLDQIIPPDNSTPSLIENDENNCDDDEHIHQKYIEMLTHDYMNSQRAKKDKELRQKSRKMFSVLSNVMHRAHSDPLVNTSGVINIGLEPDTNRGRDSDLRTLQNANKLLESLIKDCRKLKIYRATLKKDLKAHKKSRKKARKKPACVTDPQVSVNSPPSYHKKPSGDSQYLVRMNYELIVTIFDHI